MQVKDLNFNVAALKEFKKITGVSPFESDFSDPDLYSALVYVGLNQGKYKTTGIEHEKVDEELNYNDMPIVIEAFQSSWENLNTLGKKK